MSVYDELYVISDLHLGGITKERQIFDQGPLLGKTIEHLAIHNPSKRVALCINGDTVDFLAETKPPAVYFDAENAIRKLDRIVKDSSFKMIWKALTRFVKADKRTLIITLGNHDLELALPWVKNHLIEILAGSDAAAKGRIKLEFDGQGHRCRVGQADVFCVHGNDVDTWNVTDYEALRRFARDFQQGRPKAWRPNAGTKLVIDVMNDIKRDFPFVDLLKPEGLGLVNVLYSLKPSLKSRIARCAGVATTLSWDKLRRLTGFLADDEEDDSVEVAPALVGAGTDSTTTSRREDKRATAHKLMRQAENYADDGLKPIDLLSAESRTSSLGYISAFFDWVVGRDKVEILRESLESMGDFPGFDLKHLDDTFKQMDQLVDESVDFVVTGHTHQEKAICRSRGEGVYFNCGTWVRLMRLEPDVLNNERRFRRLYAILAQGKMKALDDAPGVVMRRPAMVAILKKSANRTAAQLVRPELDGATLKLQPIANSQFERSF